MQRINYEKYGLKPKAKFGIDYKKMGRSLFTFGRHRNKTFEYIIATDPHYCERCIAGAISAFSERDKCCMRRFIEYLCAVLCDFKPDADEICKNTEMIIEVQETYFKRFNKAFTPLNENATLEEKIDWYCKVLKFWNDEIPDLRQIKEPAYHQLYTQEFIIKQKNLFLKEIEKDKDVYCRVITEYVTRYFLPP